MEKFFNSLDSIGFKSVEDIESLKPTHDKERTRRSLNQSLPKEYLSVIKNLSNEKRRDILLKKASSINLFIKTKFNETNIFMQWSELGTIPHYYHNGLNTKTISFIAKSILRIRKKIESDKDRISQLESLEKPRSQQIISLEKAHDRIKDNEVRLADLENEFYFEFIDFESSLGGIY